MKSKNWFKANAGNVELAVTATGGAATAFLHDNVIEIDFTNTDTTASYVVETPLGFKVVDAKFIANATATGAVVYVDNSDTNITSDIGAATDTYVARTTKINDASYAFSSGDDDLTISASSTATAACVDGIIYIDIVPA